MQILTFVLGVVLLTVVVCALVLVLMVAKSRLVNSEAVTIHVNGDPELSFSAPAGDTLLNILANQKMFIPSACGGKGSCGVCKVDVHEGGGAMLPTEQSHILSLIHI